MVPGTADTYTIVVTNTGPSTATGATVADTMPGRPDRHDLDSHGDGRRHGLHRLRQWQHHQRHGDHAGGSTVTYTVTGTIDPTATGTLANTATVTAPTGVTDPNTANNTRHRHRHADAAGRPGDHQDRRHDHGGAGHAVTYTIVVTNSGPSTATGATVADTVPAYLTGTTWTATATGGATGFTTSRQRQHHQRHG